MHTLVVCLDCKSVFSVTMLQWLLSWCSCRTWIIVWTEHHTPWNVRTINMYKNTCHRISQNSLSTSETRWQNWLRHRTVQNDNGSKSAFLSEDWCTCIPQQCKLLNSKLHVCKSSHTSLNQYDTLVDSTELITYYQHSGQMVWTETVKYVLQVFQLMICYTRYTFVTSKNSCGLQYRKKLKHGTELVVEDNNSIGIESGMVSPVNCKTQIKIFWRLAESGAFYLFI